MRRFGPASGTSRGHRGALFLATFLVLELLLGGCGGQASEAAGWASEVERLRAVANDRARAGARDEAIAVLREALALGTPADSTSDPRVIGIRQDAHFALGRLLLGAGRHEEAIVEATRGLELAQTAPEELSRSVFAANLLALRAMAREQAGEPEAAVGDYERALMIHSRLFEEALADHQGSSR